MLPFVYLYNLLSHSVTGVSTWSCDAKEAGSLAKKRLRESSV